MQTTLQTTLTSLSYSQQQGIKALLKHLDLSPEQQSKVAQFTAENNPQPTQNAAPTDPTVNLTQLPAELRRKIAFFLDPVAAEAVADNKKIANSLEFWS